DLSLHLLQLHEEHALRRRRSRSPALSIGTTIIRPRRRRIPRAARGASRLIFDYWHLCRCEQRQAKYNKGQSMAVLEHGLLLAQLYTAVLSPGLLVVTHGNRTLFAVGNQFQLSWGNTLQNQVTLYGLGTTLTQSHVVLASTTLVGVAFQNDTVAGSLQILGMDVQSTHGFRLQIGAVVFEVERSDGAQSSFFAHAAVDGTSVRTVTGVRIDTSRAFARIIATL